MSLKIRMRSRMVALIGLAIVSSGTVALASPAAHAETIYPNIGIVSPVAYGYVPALVQYSLETTQQKCSSFHQQWRVDWEVTASATGVYVHSIKLEVRNDFHEGFQIGNKFLKGGNGNWENNWWGDYVTETNGGTYSKIYPVGTQMTWDHEGKVTFNLSFEEPFVDEHGNPCFGGGYTPLFFGLKNAGAAAGTEPPTGSLGDFNHDTKPDVLTRNSSGELWVYPGNGADGFGGKYRIGSGFGMMNSISVGDFNGDGWSDLLCRVASTGELRIFQHTKNTSTPYSGNGILAGSGWNIMTSINVGDVNYDRKVDIVARDQGGDLWLFLGNGNSTFAGRKQIGEGWNTTNAINVVDFTLDGWPEIIMRNPTTGTLTMYVHSKDPARPYDSGRIIGDSGFQSMNAFLVGDFNRDGKPDLVTRVTNDGGLKLYRHTGSPNAPLSSSIPIGSSWNSFTDID